MSLASRKDVEKNELFFENKNTEKKQNKKSGEKQHLKKNKYMCLRLYV